jgi:SAM-dependent methyltransferase
MRIDFDPTSADYAKYRVEFAPGLFDRLRRFGIGLPGQKTLDLGSGTGLFASAMAKNGVDVTLLDSSRALLLQSDHANRVIGGAELLPFADEVFDVVTAAQCWHWFDRSRAPREIMRVLRPAGIVAVVYQTYIPLHGSVAEATENVILKHRPGWRHANSTGINGQVLRDFQSLGFSEIESFSFDIQLQFLHEAWRGFIRTNSPIGTSMSATQVEKFDLDHAEMLHAWPETLSIPHRVFAAVARKPPLGYNPEL